MQDGHPKTEPLPGENAECPDRNVNPELDDKEKLSWAWNRLDTMIEVGQYYYSYV